RYADHADRGFPDVAGVAAYAMDATARLARDGGLEAYVPPSGVRGDESGEDARALRLARAASCGSYHVTAGAERVVGAVPVSSFWFLVSSPVVCGVLSRVL